MNIFYHVFITKSIWVVRKNENIHLNIEYSILKNWEKLCPMGWISGALCIIESAKTYAFAPEYDNKNV